MLAPWFGHVLRVVKYVVSCAASSAAFLRPVRLLRKVLRGLCSQFGCVVSCCSSGASGGSSTDTLVQRL